MTAVRVVGEILTDTALPRDGTRGHIAIALARSDRTDHFADQLSMDPAAGPVLR